MCIPCLEVRQAQPDTRLGLMVLAPIRPSTAQRCGPAWSCCPAGAGPAGRAAQHGPTVDGLASSAWPSASTAARTIPNGPGSVWPAPPRWRRRGGSARSARSSASCSATWSGSPPRPTRPTPRRSRPASAPTTTGPGVRSSASAARSRSSSATPWWGCSGCPPPTRTTPSGRCGRPSTWSRPSTGSTRPGPGWAWPSGWRSTPARRWSCSTPSPSGASTSSPGTWPTPPRGCRRSLRWAACWWGRRPGGPPAG